LITEIQDALRVNLVPRCTTAMHRHTGPMQPNRHLAVVDPKLGTDPALRPTCYIQLDSSVHIHDRHPKFGGSRQRALGHKSTTAPKTILAVARRLGERGAGLERLGPNGVRCHT